MATAMQAVGQKVAKIIVVEEPNAHLTNGHRRIPLILKAIGAIGFFVRRQFYLYRRRVSFHQRPIHRFYAGNARFIF